VAATSSCLPCFQIAAAALRQGKQVSSLLFLSRTSVPIFARRGLVYTSGCLFCFSFLLPIILL
jgi:hypothetical protein